MWEWITGNILGIAFGYCLAVLVPVPIVSQKILTGWRWLAAYVVLTVARIVGK